MPASRGSWPKNNSDWWRLKIGENRARDRDTERQLEECGWTVIRFWEHEATDECARTVVAVVSALSVDSA